jgi:agmatinase
METKPSYDPNAPADSSAGIFGLPFSYGQSKVVYVPVPWEATTSYGGGTVHGPRSILDASAQLDLYDLDVEKPYECGLHALAVPEDLIALDGLTRKLAEAVKDALGEVSGNAKLEENLRIVNRNSKELNRHVRESVSRILADNKIPGIIGGDHSVPLGAFEAAAAHLGHFGILHFDAHSDTRNAYMGFSDSHASIMRNAAEQIPQITRFTQIGIRDFCEEEALFTASQPERFSVFYDQQISSQKMQGTPFSKIATSVIETLPEKVWVSFDIDGLDPRFCPHTGTPVPGGLEYSEAIFLLRMLARSGRKIIGFDVVEVAPPLTDDGAPKPALQAAEEWDANVGMRLIYKLSAFALASQGHAAWRF